MTSIFYAEGALILIKFRRLVQNHMLTAVIWSKSKPEAEFQYRGRFEEFNGMSSQSTRQIAGWKNFTRYIENRFAPYFIFFCFLNVVWALASDGFRIVSDTLVVIQERARWIKSLALFYLNREKVRE